MNSLIFGDCLELMKGIPDGAIDMILCDLPYGITSLRWDLPIPLDKLWEQYTRIIRPDGAIVLTASQPFTSLLVTSNLPMFRYEWIWEKDKPSNFGVSKYQPLKYHESVLVFSKNKSPRYFPQMWKGNLNHSVGKGIRRGVLDRNEAIHASIPVVFYKNNNGMKFPKSVQHINRETGLHPTQKPVALFEYLIKTYTTTGDLVLDNAAGSGTTGIACLNTKRWYILMENDEKYYNIAKQRLEEYESRTL